MKLAILIWATLLSGAICICPATGAQAADTQLAMNEAQCQVAWSIASPNGATLSKDEAVPYVLDFTGVDTSKDAVIDANEFKAACQGGLTKFWPEGEGPDNASRGCKVCCPGHICMCCQP